MDKAILTKIYNLNAVFVLICATAYSKTDDNRWSGEAKLC